MNSPKIEKLNIDTLIIPQGLSIHEKTRVQKSHATVPLKGAKEHKGYRTKYYNSLIRGGSLGT